MELRLSLENMKFMRKVQDLSGENVLLCYQCGECSASCPMASEMDLLPSTLIRLVQLGHKDVLNSKTIWLCSSCFSCLVRCPRGLDLSRVMEALRQMNLRRNIDYVRLEEVPKEEVRKLPQMAIISNLRKFTA